MRRKNLQVLKVLWPAALCIGFPITAVQAHHSTTGLYDDTQVLELTGVVKRWRFTNPHPFLILEVEGPDGEMIEWDVSYGGAAVVHLRRQGYTVDTFKAGDVINLRGRPALAEGVHGLLIQGHPTNPDGEQVVAGGSMF